MLHVEQRRQLASGIAAEVKFNHPLKNYTTFGIGGVAAAFVLVASRKELMFLLRFCDKEGLPLLCLGRGSNVLLVKEFFPGVVFRLSGEFKQVDLIAAKEGLGGMTVYAGAGIGLAQLVRFCEEQGAGGLEFAAGIPGTLGGAVLMNAGAWGSDMAAVIRCVELQKRQDRVLAKGDELDFTYRSWPWFLRENSVERMVITAVELNLTAEAPASIAQRCRELALQRRQKQKIKRPNAGSFFKNPEGESAGRLIESCGLKGLRIGDAMVAQEHANFFVNMGAARAEDMLELMRVVQETVLEKCGVALEPEVRIIS